ncbi:adenosylcobinamide-GDP ribazoletransferase [Halochromatium glycolicum]|uniref:Adenosylcobinamide-GDP ribazoletransferase n=1 Tax=Halochromatium glycolicum TaxID=85075 RepID=A0AAJ0U2A7_9GAMM|nr:adenosylcobinamide-GDP ribazoletransferase [Halochromatium glycolicum]MBK1703979.1 adenosylcobinamide-GDP ribazoletransferase [Halochromatium glycolicum]
MIRPCLLAARFLTRAPLPDPGAADAATLGRSALCYPLVGLLLGGGLAVLWLATTVLPGGAPSLASAALLLVAWTWGTGGLHLDGLSDCADAWVGGLGSRERTLELLKDPLTGSMGVVAIVLVLLVKLAALASLPAGPAAGLILLLAPTVARLQLLVLALTTISARPEGLGTALRQTLPRRAAQGVVGFSVGALLLVLALAGLGLAGLVSLMVAGLLLWRWRRSLLERLGGFTGDTAGALVELTEAAVLLTLVLLVRG